MLALVAANIGIGGGGNPHDITDTLIADCHNQKTKRYDLDHLQDLMNKNTSNVNSDLEIPRSKRSKCITSMLDNPERLDGGECPFGF